MAWKCAKAILMLAVFLAGAAGGQELPDWLAKSANARPPDFGVRDESGFFSRDSGSMKRISDQLRKLEADHGFRIYLLVEPVLIATTAPELAAQLQQSWLPQGDGLVVVYPKKENGHVKWTPLGGAFVMAGRS